MQINEQPISSKCDDDNEPICPFFVPMGNALAHQDPEPDNTILLRAFIGQRAVQKDIGYLYPQTDPYDPSQPKPANDPSAGEPSMQLDVYNPGKPKNIQPIVYKLVKPGGDPSKDGLQLTWTNNQGKTWELIVQIKNDWLVPTWKVVQ